MKKGILFSVSVLAVTGVLLVGPARADDHVEHDWSGLYGGLHAGYGGGHSDWLFTNTGTTSSPNIDGFVVGGHVGWNFQTGSWVFGPEGDASLSAIDGSAACPNPAFSCQLDVDFLASIRARAGVTVGAFLPFITGGVAFGGVDPIARNLVGAADFDAASKTHVGWVVGGGVEYWAYMDDRVKISTRLEVLYYDLGEKTYNLTSPAGATDPARIDVWTIVVRAGISFHF